MNLSPDTQGSLLLVANQLGSSVTAYARDLTSGTLIQIASIDSTPDISAPSFIFMKEIN